MGDACYYDTSSKHPGGNPHHPLFKGQRANGGIVSNAACRNNVILGFDSGSLTFNA